jgi:hypothetical protein
MKKTRIILVLAALLGVVTAWLFLSRRSGTYNRSDVEFAVTDTSLITGVEIAGGGRQVSLTRHDGTWSVNGSAPVRRDRMTGMLVLLSRLEVLSPVSRSRAGEVSRQLQQEGKRVTVNLKKGGDREYFVIYEGKETDATYMMLVDADTPFRMGVRGYRQRDLAALYATDERYWRQNILLHFLPEQIASISLRNNLDPAKTFHLARNEQGVFEMATGVVPGDWLRPAAARLQQYLGYFNGVRFESYADMRQDETVKYTYHDEPDYVLEVSSTAGSQTTLELFPVYWVDLSGTKKMDLNLLYARMNDLDGMVIVKYPEIDPLLKDPGYFQGR